MAKKNKELEEASKKHVEEQEAIASTEKKSIGNIEDIRETTENHKGRKVKKSNQEIEEKEKLGFKNIPLKSLPSQGLFYPAGTKIIMRAANGEEIKHWSTIDENDGYNIDDLLNFIIERCVQIVIPNKHASYKDIKDIDRFWLIFAIREFTFKNGENKLYADIPTNNGSERVEVIKDVINYYNPPKKLMKFYNEDKKYFIFKLKNGEEIKLYFPNIGISSFLKDFRRNKEQQQQSIDEDFAKYSLFLFPDWRGLNLEQYEKEQQKSHGWSIQKISLLTKFVDLIKESVNPTMTVDSGAGEVTVPLNFRGGLKAIFVISDILDELE